jgi:hypothetical protein
VLPIRSRTVRPVPPSVPVVGGSDCNFAKVMRSLNHNIPCTNGFFPPSVFDAVFHRFSPLSIGPARQFRHISMNDGQCETTAAFMRR